jgi:hypothetical protein
MASNPANNGKQAANNTTDDIAPVAAQQPRVVRMEKAAQFLAEHSSENRPFTYEEEKAVVRRIDGRVLVVLLGAYFFQQLDKSSLRCVISASSYPYSQGWC